MPDAQLPWFYRVFDLRDRDTTGYAFSMPGIMISGEDISIDWDRGAGQWRAVQEQDGHTGGKQPAPATLRWSSASSPAVWGVLAHFAPLAEEANEYCTDLDDKAGPGAA
jgi:hypothetical protein